MSLRLFADPAHASQTVTSVHMPEGVEWGALNGDLRSRGLILAGGQGTLTGRIFRIGHLGDVGVRDIVAALETLEAGATSLGIAIAPGGPSAARVAGESVLAGAAIAPAALAGA
jgi:aspartate aminotransferase-like enzyme